MTTLATHQFIAIYGGPALAKGARYEEPLHDNKPAVAFIMGQQDYLAIALRYGSDVSIICPFVIGSPDAERWARGKLYERKIERLAVEAYKVGRAV